MSSIKYRWYNGSVTIYCDTRNYIIIIIIIIIIRVIIYMQVFTNTPETNHVSRVYSVPLAVYLQFVLHVMLFRP